MAVKVLFLCVHNSARSQMAEAYLKKLGGAEFIVDSAGLEKGNLNPLAVQVMKEEGIDISKNETNDVFDFFKQGRMYQYVITVCDAKSAERCPVFPGIVKMLNWSFDDPAKFTGTEEEKLQQTRKVRDRIKGAIENFLRSFES